MSHISATSRITPWADWSEWRALKRLLSENKYRQAQLVLDAYFYRRRNAVPIALATTITLVNQLNDTTKDEYTQRLGFSMAITRFVNGLTDKLQPRGDGSSARSVYALALELGLPLILVEIRHQASHNLLPRLKTLQSGAKQALQWLETNYWIPQEERIMSSKESSLEQIRNELRALSSNVTSNIDIDMVRSRATMPNSFFTISASQPTATVLPRLLNLQKAIEKRKQNRRKLRTFQTVPNRASNRVVSEKRWVLCDNPKEWRVCPIGLIPSQAIVSSQLRTFTYNDDNCNSSTPASDVTETIPKTCNLSVDYVSDQQESGKSSGETNDRTNREKKLEQKISRRQSHYAKLLADE